MKRSVSARVAFRNSLSCFFGFRSFPRRPGSFIATCSADYATPSVFLLQRNGIFCLSWRPFQKLGFCLHYYQITALHSFLSYHYIWCALCGFPNYFHLDVFHYYPTDVENAWNLVHSCFNFPRTITSTVFFFHGNHAPCPIFWLKRM